MRLDSLVAACCALTLLSGTSSAASAVTTATPAVAKKPASSGGSAAVGAASAKAPVTTTGAEATSPSATAVSKPAAAGKMPRALEVESSAKPAGADDLTLKGGQEGTVFRNLTVEGEDRVHIDFDRPELKLDLDPTQAPGLEWGSARDVLDRTLPDLTGPFLASTARAPSDHLARPWLDQLASGPVARFEPSVKGAERWKLVVVDAHGQAVATFEGQGDPPATIEWDGRRQGGGWVVPGLTYSYYFEAFDRAGNKRHFVGQGFSVSAHRLDSPQGPTLLFSGAELAATDPTGSPGAVSATSAATGGEVAAVAPILLEAASWINQWERTSAPLEVKATARSYDQAIALASSVTAALAPLVLGDPARLRPVTAVEPDSPEAGTVTIAPMR